jgi:hypothetical protein
VPERTNVDGSELRVHTSFANVLQRLCGEVHVPVVLSLVEDVQASVIQEKSAGVRIGLDTEMETGPRVASHRTYTHPVCF